MSHNVLAYIAVQGWSVSSGSSEIQQQLEQNSR
jgi:hypothetical protein